MQELIKRAKKRLLQMHFESGVGHIGGNLSALDAMLVLHHRIMRPEDVFVLSKGHAAGDHWIVLTSPKADGTFEARKPQRYGDRLSLSDFMDRLLPETRRERTSRIKEFVDDQFADANLIVDILYAFLAPRVRY